MGRAIAMARKGAPSVDVQDEDGPGDDDSGNASTQDDSVECPNCQCVFDAKTGEVAEQPEGVEPEGADLDVSAEPVPGKFGAAADAARGTSSIAQLLGSLGG